MDVQNPKTPLHTCAKQWCHRKLAADYKWKQCKHCREHNPATKRNQHVKEKAKKNNATPQDSTSKKGKRRAEEDKSSSLTKPLFENLILLNPSLKPSAPSSRQRWM
jgi:hypothetical protein